MFYQFLISLFFQFLPCFFDDACVLLEARVCVDDDQSGGLQ